MKALLALEDGTVFSGKSFGGTGTAKGELVFNTGMTGYPEILTDPSYRGQMVCMTYPLIGNYGITREDFESRDVWLSAFIVKEASRRASSWRSEQTLSELLKQKKVVGIEGLDTRKLVKHIRSAGSLKAAISTTVGSTKELIEIAQNSPGMVGRDLVKEVTSAQAYDWTDALINDKAPEAKFKVVVIDFGVKYNILRKLVSAGCEVRVVPASTSADAILALSPDGVMLSNGPGDPEPLSDIIAEIQKLIGKVPLFGICLGHQLLGLALGGKTFKLKFGHHGCNQPVMDLSSRKVEITSQNHGFCVDIKSLDQDLVKTTHINLNDQTSEGLRHLKLPLFSVQYHPEAAPGPHDADYLFKRFKVMMEGGVCQSSSL